MTEPNETAKPAKSPSCSDHMANERTFLAWIRTVIGIMAFGFVVEKFAFFIRKFSYFVDKTLPPETNHSHIEFSSIFGIVLVAMGGLMGILAFIRYKKVEWEINEGNYKPSLLLDIMVTLGIITIGIFLVFYMLHSLK